MYYVHVYMCIHECQCTCAYVYMHTNRTIRAPKNYCLARLLLMGPRWEIVCMFPVTGYIGESAPRSADTKSRSCSHRAPTANIEGMTQGDVAAGAGVMALIFIRV